MFLRVQKVGEMIRKIYGSLVHNAILHFLGITI
jgi:hypothetical protein